VLRRKIERQRDVNSLFDLPKLTGAIEAAYQRMWRRWLAREQPAAFVIEDVA
jgi:predicted O-linked N-acetylglucosamine transferase (SPINDLY family)